VLTLFERLTAEQLPFYLHLMKHLALRGIPVPDPQANAQGDILHTVCGKPAAVVNRLRGRSSWRPGQCTAPAVGDMLARMHLAGRDYDRSSPTCAAWPGGTTRCPWYCPPDCGAGSAFAGRAGLPEPHWRQPGLRRPAPRPGACRPVPRQRDVRGRAADRLLSTSTFAGVDTFLFDLAVCMNDWCIDLPTGAHNGERASALLQAYEAVRPLTAAERSLLPAMARAGALRFWISRLWDWHLPREAEVLTPHDPQHFERVLRQRVAHPLVPCANASTCLSA
jgi:homoserine kinase type II